MEGTVEHLSSGKKTLPPGVMFSDYETCNKFFLMTVIRRFLVNLLQVLKMWWTSEKCDDDEFNSDFLVRIMNSSSFTHSEEHSEHSEHSSSNLSIQQLFFEHCQLKVETTAIVPYHYVT